MAATAAAAATLTATGVHAASRVVAVSPQGDVAEVRQITVRFSDAVVPAGDPRRPAPFVLLCQGGTAASAASASASAASTATASAPAPAAARAAAAAATTPPGNGHWTSDRSWSYEPNTPLAAGLRCTLAANPQFQPLDGEPLQGQRAFSFNTGAPVVLGVQPYPGSRIEEDQNFLLRLNGPVLPASVTASAWCEVEGLAERIPLTIVTGAPRAEVLRQRRHRGTGASDDANALLVACQRNFAPDARMRLVWGAGIAAAGQPALVSRRAQRFEWKVRERFTVEFSCERQNAQSACLPLRPMVLRFNAPVPRAQALAVRLQPDKGQPIAPRVNDEQAGATLSELRFAAPLPENTRFRMLLPANLRDDSGRALHNAGNYPLAVATGALPPLAKFAGAPFGIVEAGTAAEPAMLPMTLRHVQADLAGASTGGRVAIKRLDPATSDAELLAWIVRLRQDNDEQMVTRSKPLLATEAGVQRADLPQLKTTEPRATEVIGIPLPQRGYHVVEVESRILGNALLAAKGPMYARTGALVTNLGVHFKRGRSSSLVWVTTLDRARPVANARVAVNDCRGQPLWNGSTDANGIATIARGFEREYSNDGRCRDGYFVTARLGDDLAFVFSEWARGIESWRFNISSNQGTVLDSRAHTVFDRTLLRAGDTVQMKHFVRIDTERGLALPATDALPTEVRIRHLGSDFEVKLPLAWPRGARASDSSWAIPKNAALGVYDVALLGAGERGQGGRRGRNSGTEMHELASGSFRVEAFRVPLVDARLTGPQGAAVVVGNGDIAFNAQLNAMAGGPMPGQPLKLSALLRQASVNFPQLDDFTFSPPGQRGRDREGDETAEGNDGSKLVADKLAASTDKQGAARIVVKGLPAITAPSDLATELTFNDPNGEVQTVAQTLRIWPAAVVVGLRVPGWTAIRGKDGNKDGGEASVTAVVLDTNGKPLTGRSVDVIGRLHQTMTTRKRIVGGFYAYDNRHEVRELGTLCSGKSDGQGRVGCSVKLDDKLSGEVELVARTKDDAGRLAEAASSVWVSGRGEWWFDQDNDDRIDVLAEQREVQPGQTARLQVRMPFRQATALVSVEREGILDTRIVQLSGREPVIELPIPNVSKASDGSVRSWAPNVVVSVLVLRGRLREAPWWSIFTWGWKQPGDWWQAFRYEGRDWRAPSAVVDLAKPSFKLGAAELTVGLADHKLEVQVSADKPVYKVRDTANAVVKVSFNGKPLAGAEVAFAAVDEGLLALRPNDSWNLLQGLLQPRPWGVETATAQSEIIGRRHYGRKALPPGGGGGRNPTRELFDTLLLWRGTVQLDAKGEARIAVPLNDSLTSFRLVAIADAGPDKFGTGSATVRVSQDLQMLAGLPPLAREDDSFDAAFTLRNTTARSVTLRASLAGKVSGTAMTDSKPLQTAPQTLTLAAGASQELRWTVTVPNGITRIDWEGAAEETSGNAPLRDRIKVTQVIAPAVPARVLQATLLQLDGKLQLPLSLPAGAIAGSSSVQVGLQPKLSSALPGLRRFFETYPYSCIEQKTSRAIGLHDGPGWSRTRDELAGYLDSDGLANYFPPQAGSAARGSDKLTAYLVAAAHEAGLQWPDAQRDAMLRGLQAFVEGRLERRFPAPRADLDVRKLAALEALSRYGRVQPRMLGSVNYVPAAWPTSALLDAWSLYKRVDNLPDRAARLDELQRLIRSRLTMGGTTLKFSSEADDDWWWLMDGPDANAARLVLLAADVPAWKAELPQLVNGALARQRRGAWGTTTANLWGVLALEKFAAQFESAAVAGRSTVQLASASRTVDWQTTPAGSVQSLPWPVGASTLQAQHDGAGKPWLTLQMLAAVPLKAPLFAGYRITRQVNGIERKVANAWSRGDTVRVRLEVEASTDMAWVVISDPVPTGATILGTGLGRDSAIATQGEQREGRSWPVYEERGADAWRAYYDWLPRGRHVIEYTLRLNSSGHFRLPPTRVEAMYAPETFGELPNAALDVK